MGTLASGAARDGGRVAILTYHSVDESGSVLSTAPGLFAEQMRALHESGVPVLPLAEAIRQWRRRSLPGRAVVITFDDGFRSVLEKGLPVLLRYGFTATVFVVSDYCGRDNAWPTQPPGFVRGPLLSWSEVRALCAAGFGVGAHSRTHPDLTRLSPRQAEEEIAGSKRAIEDQAQAPVEAFAYPYGVYDERVRDLATAHFAVACSTRFGFARRESDLLALERLDAYYLKRPRLLERLFSADVGAYLACRRVLRGVRRRMAGAGDY